MRKMLSYLATALALGSLASCSRENTASAKQEVVFRYSSKEVRVTREAYDCFALVLATQNVPALSDYFYNLPESCDYDSDGIVGANEIEARINEIIEKEFAGERESEELLDELAMSKYSFSPAALLAAKKIAKDSELTLDEIARKADRNSDGKVSLREVAQLAW
ncbi:hypothetical protein D6817_04145 [Candidatus Pacearchaeota archaeon]|nr:MAG: hypothetical protein D6817_04145 [Candidatus Pacearchaeota archaeon]